MSWRAKPLVCLGRHGLILRPSLWYLPSQRWMWHPVEQTTAGEKDSSSLSVCGFRPRDIQTVSIVCLVQRYPLEKTALAAYNNNRR